MIPDAPLRAAHCLLQVSLLRDTDAPRRRSPSLGGESYDYVDLRRAVSAPDLKVAADAVVEYLATSRSPTTRSAA